MKIKQFEEKLAKIPLAIKLNKESIISLDSNIRLYNGADIVKRLDNIGYEHQFENIVITSQIGRCKNRFPVVNIKEPFWELDVNKNLFEKFGFAQELFIKQSSINNEIEHISKSKDFILLVIVDGLSYTDCLRWENTIPCIVDTATITECGFKNIIGTKDSIAFRLFKNKYTKSIGFSYWDRSNQLADEIYRNFTSLHKVQRFADIKKKIKTIDINKTYIQITLNGLDGIAHQNRDEPLIKPIVENIYYNLKEIIRIVEEKGRKGTIFLVSDHGILWKHKSALKKINDDLNVKSHMRYYSTKVNISWGHCFSGFGNNYTSLKYPFITRNMRTNEWGTHGGISIEESIVPYLKWNIN